MKVIVAGGRDVTDLLVVSLAIQDSCFQITELVSGGAKGVDDLGELWARTYQVPIRRFPADWNTHGRAAGPIRNKQMAEYADALILIPTGGPGSRSMLSIWQAIKPSKPYFVCTCLLPGFKDVKDSE